MLEQNSKIPIFLLLSLEISFSAAYFQITKKTATSFLDKTKWQNLIKSKNWFIISYFIFW